VFKRAVLILAASCVVAMAQTTGAGTLVGNVTERPWWPQERYKFQLRFDGNNFPFKQPNFANPGAAYNANSPGSFARMTGVQGSFSNLGFGRPNYYVIGRFEF
jgi:hypothetical protein